MPNYSQSDIKFIIGTDEFTSMYNNAEGRQDRAWLTVLWFTGARPSEILELRKKDIIINPESIQFVLSTKKLGFRKSDGFIIEKRTLVLKISEKNRYVKNLCRYLEPFKDGELIFSFSRRHGLNIIYRISMRAFGFKLCPYNFRHSRLTLLAEKGATIEELKRFKGARGDKSVTNYLHARKVEYSVDIEL